MWNSVLVQSCKPVPKKCALEASLISRLLSAAVRVSQLFINPIPKSKNQAFCKLCRRITIPRLQTGLYHHRTLQCLEASATSCPLCSLLFSCLKEDTDPSGDFEWPTRLWLQLAGSNSTCLNVSIGNHDGRVRVFTERDDPNATVISGRPIRPHADSTENFELIRSWLTDCIDNHIQCRLISQSSEIDPELPKRVIDLGEVTDKNAKVRVLHSNGQKGRWVALSHTWGKLDLPCLTQETQDCFGDEIQLSILPRTFRDAIYITRQLGLRYLWIDTLCILQDSKDDWQAESAHMPSIYAEAHLVLAANATPTSHGGILRKRVLSSCTLNLGRGTSLSFGFEVNRSTPDYLGARAWCFQEEQLGRRRLAYFEEYMEFSCACSWTTEDDDDLNKLGPRHDPEKSFLFCRTIAGAVNTIQRLGLQELGKSKICDKLFYDWYSYTGSYSSRNLTRPEDKLVAISGLASLIGQHVEDRYLAGIWQTTLSYGLLWYRFGQQMLQKPELYRAPSWSWASVDGQIHCQVPVNLDSRADFELLEASITPLGIDPYGQISAGFLRLRAPLKKAVVGPNRFVQGRSRIYSYTTLLDPDGDRSIGGLSTCTFDTKELLEGTTIWCLGIQKANGLIIEPILEQPDEFRRIGVFSLCDDMTSDVEWFQGYEKQIVTIL